MKSLVTISTVIILVGCLLFTFFEQLAFPDARIKFLGSSKRVELTPNEPVRQVFLLTQNHFRGFQIFMGDTELSLSERLEFTLLDASCSSVLTQKTVTMLSQSPKRALQFSFDPIVNSKDVSYCLSIRYLPGFTERTKRPFIRATENDDFQTASYTDLGKNTTYSGRSLQVRPLYASSSLIDRIQTLENRLSQYKPVLFKGLVLTIGSLATLLGIIFFWMLSKKTEV